MTNEQAIKHLTAKLECMARSKGFREKCDTYNSYEGCYECDLGYKQGNIGEQIESLKLAIKALDQEPCDDCISREQAKTAIRDRFKDLPSRVEINTILNDLPSVTPSYNSIKTELKSCEDCISREQAIDLIADYEFYELNMGQVAKGIRDLPSVAPQPKSGHWIKVSDGYGDNAYICECSECKDTVWVYKDADRKWNYCPNCGCRMTEGRSEE